MTKIIIEIQPCGDVTTCLRDGEAITPDHESADDWRDACASGDCQDACEYIRDNLNIEFRTVALQADGKTYKNVTADAETKQQCCESIYFESESDFSDEALAETYLIWQAASNLVDGEWRDSEAAS